MSTIVSDLSFLATTRDGAWKRSRAAREYTDWEAALELQSKAPGTRLGYAYTVWDLLELWPEKTVSEFTSGDCEQLLRRYPEKGRATRAAHLASFFRYLHKRRRLIPENPMDFVDRPKSSKGRLPNVFSEAEIAQLYALASPDGPLIVLMVELGLRNRECRRLKRKHLDLSRAEARILQSKNDKDRIIPMTQRACEAVTELDLLEGLVPEDHLWYAKPGGAAERLTRRFLSPDGCAEATFARWWHRCLEEAGVPYRKPHMTRHTFATRWRRRGLDLDELQLLLGHASVQTTSDLYVHTDVQDVARRMIELEAVS